MLRRFSVLLAVAAALMAACGIKGPLRLPPEKAGPAPTPPAAPAPPDAAAPAEAAPAPAEKKQ